MVQGTEISKLTTPPSQIMRDTDKKTMTDHVYITFRIAQLISSFRRRIKTRVLSNATSKASNARLQQGLNDEFEKEVLEVVSKCRKSRRPTHRKNRNVRSETRKQPQVVGNSGFESRFARVEDTEPLKESFCSVECLLAQLDSKLSQKGSSILDLATDDRHLLNRWYEIDFAGGLHKAAELLALTDRLLDIIDNAFPTGLAGDKVLCEGKEIMSDSIHASNLEHILLCLQNDLLKFLLIDPAWMKIFAHMIDCQKEQSRRCETWFFEFPDARRPLSTTWPWSIRPSLAVIWGVCWMFIYEYFEDSEGNLHLESGGLLPLHEILDPSLFGSPPATQPSQPSHTTPRPTPHSPSIYQPQHGTFTSATVTDQDVPRHHISNAGSTQPHYPYVEHHETASAHYRSGRETSAAFIGQTGPPERVGSSEYYSNSSLGLQRLQGIDSRTTNPFLFPPWTDLLDIPIPDHPFVQVEYPTSPHLTMTTTTTIPKSEKGRELSVPLSEKDSLIGSQDGSSVKDEEFVAESPSSLPPPRSRSRREPKIVTADGKFICTTCHQAFERKCEWNKHMDKHERPYKCEQSQCAKLLGFTYSGGLLRHEREVHNMHGGPKAQLFCPVIGCKRHSAQGFTRKENLVEHLRRVHPNYQYEESVSASTPVSRASEAASEWSVVNPEPTKRKRGSLTNEDSMSQLPDDGVGREIKRLRHENGDLRRKYEDQQEQLMGWKDEMTKMKQGWKDEMTRMKQQIEQMLELQREAGSG